jgi:ATP-dependent DNA helicase RecG
LLSGPSHYFDEEPVVDATSDDLDDLAIRDFFAQAYPNWSPIQSARYLRALQAVDRSGTPTVTGILLFGREPQQYLLDAYVTAIRFPGNEVRSQFSAREELRGRLVSQLDGAVAFLAAQHPPASAVSGVVRRETGVPVEIWREAVANALAHRDYQAAAQTRIFVFDDRVEIANPGILLNQLTIDGLRLGVTQRRNPHIAAALARRQRRENAGVGIPDMIQTLVERGLPEPELRVESGDFRLTIFTPKGAGSEATHEEGRDYWAAAAIKGETQATSLWKIGSNSVKALKRIGPVTPAREESICLPTRTASRHSD